MLDTLFTQFAYRELTGSNPSFFMDYVYPDRPVDRVSKAQAEAFCAELGVRVFRGEQNSWSFRLPTEAEWECAARAGGPGQGVQNPNPLDARPVDHRRIGLDLPYPVKRLAPNAWGFYDMLGHLGQWCADSGAGKRVISKGEDSWASRRVEYPANRTHAYQGFRIVCVAKED
jgi:formylglycine-generating enzyme required for sulfatase activity